MSLHTHTWQIGFDSLPKGSKEELLAIISKCGVSGYWLRGEEIEFGKQLQLEGLVTLCCDGEAATIL